MLGIVIRVQDSPAEVNELKATLGHLYGAWLFFVFLLSILFLHILGMLVCQSVDPVSAGRVESDALRPYSQ